MENLRLIKINYRDDFCIKEYISLGLRLMEKYFSRFLDNKSIKELFCMETLETIKREIKNQEFNYYLIQDNSKNIGILQTKATNETLDITRIFLSNKKRKQGIGTKIIDILQSEAQKNNLKILKLPIISKDEKTKSIAQKWGFKLLKPIARYIGTDIYIYEEVYIKEIFC